MPRRNRERSASISACLSSPYNSLSSEQYEKVVKYHSGNPFPCRCQIEIIARAIKAPERLVAGLINKLNKVPENPVWLDRTPSVAVQADPEKQFDVVSKSIQTEVQDISLKSVGIQIDPDSAPIFATSVKPRSLKFFPEPKRRLNSA